MRGVPPRSLASREPRTSALGARSALPVPSSLTRARLLQLVICEACNKGWHQLCAIPPIEASVVDSILPWFCSDCDAKIAATKAPLDVSTGAEEWTTGKGEDKGAGKEGDKEAEYADEVKKEWLEGLPLHTLVGYILSVEKSSSMLPLLARRSAVH